MLALLMLCIIIKSKVNLICKQTLVFYYFNLHCFDLYWGWLFFKIFFYKKLYAHISFIRSFITQPFFSFVILVILYWSDSGYCYIISLNCWAIYVLIHNFNYYCFIMHFLSATNLIQIFFLKRSGIFFSLPYFHKWTLKLVCQILETLSLEFLLEV